VSGGAERLPLCLVETELKGIKEDTGVGAEDEVTGGVAVVVPTVMIAAEGERMMMVAVVVVAGEEGEGGALVVSEAEGGVEGGVVEVEVVAGAVVEWGAVEGEAGNELRVGKSRKQ